jgi:hypothetical protein
MCMCSARSAGFGFLRELEIRAWGPSHHRWGKSRGLQVRVCADRLSLWSRLLSRCSSPICRAVGCDFWRHRCMPTTRSWLLEQESGGESGMSTKARSVLTTFFQRGLALGQPHKVSAQPLCFSASQGNFYLRQRPSREDQLDHHQTTLLPALQHTNKMIVCYLQISRTQIPN